MDIGKFPPSLLARMLGKISVADPRVLLGSMLGEDAAILDVENQLLVAASDPVTLATDLAGWYSVHINANDVACSGALPRWFLATLLIPEHYSESDAEMVFEQILEACDAVGATLVGGHSEVTYGINRPIIMGTMLGVVERDGFIRTGGAQEGDSIVLTKGIAIEGTSLLARDRAEDLRRAGVSSETIHQAAGLLIDPGISVVRDARTACATVQVHSLHDPTEGGLATGLSEVAQASGLGLVVAEESIPVLPQCLSVCETMGLDPLGLLASGSLIITLPVCEVPPLLEALEEESLTGFEIGQMLAPEEGLISIGHKGETPLPAFPRDELYRYLAQSKLRINH